ncbi:hypothetical protein BS17DRAFT_689570, partial [Gyrodon lividus]
LKKECVSPVYAFFDLTPAIIDINGCCVHEFKCSAHSCKAKIHWYLDKKDVCLTGNMWKHVKLCWGDEALEAAGIAKDIVGGILQNGLKMAAFERKGKGKVIYSHRLHTCAETKAEIVQWVFESLCPFNIVKDRAFQPLMKTG